MPKPGNHRGEEDITILKKGVNERQKFPSINQGKQKIFKASIVHYALSNRPACPICLKYFKRAGMVKAHIKRVHEKIKNFQCDNCGYKANSKHDILRHYKAHHLLYKEDVQEDRVVCPTCGKSFKVRLGRKDLITMTEYVVISGQQQTHLPHQDQTSQHHKVFL
jgi:Zn finger protein HypA/HybF involved in hydrogenase expression